MKRMLPVLMGISLCMLAACNAEPPKIGVVDVVKAVNDSESGKKANAELDVLVKAKQAALKDKADAVENLKKALEKEPPATRKTKEDELAKAATEYQQLAAASDAEVKKKAADLRGKVIEDLKKVLETIGAEEKYLLILSNENVGYYQKTIDITEKAVKKYNESSAAK